MSPSLWSYVAGGSGDERTQRVNVTAFDDWGLMPRMFVGANDRDLSVDLFGMTLPSPVMMAPVGVIGAVRTGRPRRPGDRARRRPHRRADDRVDGCPRTRWRTSPPNSATPQAFSSCTHRRTATWPPASCSAPRRPASRASSSPWTPGCPAGGRATCRRRTSRSCAATAWPTTPATRCSARACSRPPEEDPQAAVLQWIQIFGNPLTWDDLPWLRSLTDLPLLVKGICHPDDARRASDGGVDGIYCSNHGGRQANGGMPAIDCLPGVVEAADGLPVLFDSGIRSGVDIVKAIALGATAVAVGRPYAYGLALGGVDGIVHVLRSLLAEADVTMAVDGYPVAEGTDARTRCGASPEPPRRRLRRLGRGGDPRGVRRAPRAASAAAPTTPAAPTWATCGRCSSFCRRARTRRPTEQSEPAGAAVVAGGPGRRGRRAHDAGAPHLGGEDLHRVGDAPRAAVE